MTAALALVVRDGERTTVPAAEIVPGDLLVIEEGAKIPADARLVQSVSLRTAEAALTGESAPVEKFVEPVAADAALPDRANMVFSGTAATSATGSPSSPRPVPAAEIGRIAGLLAVDREPADPAAAATRQGRQDPRRGLIAIAVAVARPSSR